MLQCFTTLQIGGTKSSRLGVLFSVNPGPDLPSLLFMKVFEITASSYRFVKSPIALWAMSLIT